MLYKLSAGWLCEIFNQGWNHDSQSIVWYGNLLHNKLYEKLFILRGNVHLNFNSLEVQLTDKHEQIN